MVDAYKKFWKNYANFNGRSTISDYWWVALWHVIVIGGLSVLSSILGNLASALIGIYYLGSLVPNLALTIRRLHDVNKSWAYIFMGLIPIAGGIILLVKMCTASVNEGNNFGEIVQ